MMKWFDRFLRRPATLRLSVAATLVSAVLVVSLHTEDKRDLVQPDAAEPVIYGFTFGPLKPPTRFPD